MLPHKLQFVLRRAVIRVYLQGLAVILFRRLPLPAFHRPIAQAAQCRALVKSSLRWVGQRFGGFLQALECAFGGGKIQQPPAADFDTVGYYTYVLTQLYPTEARQRQMWGILENTLADVPDLLQCIHDNWQQLNSPQQSK